MARAPKPSSRVEKENRAENTRKHKEQKQEEKTSKTEDKHKPGDTQGFEVS